MKKMYALEENWGRGWSLYKGTMNWPTSEIACITPRTFRTKRDAVSAISELKSWPGNRGTDFRVVTFVRDSAKGEA